MTSREIVKMAIKHQTGPRVPYFIRICGDAWEALKPRAGGKSQDEFFDNDVREIWAPWWGWAIDGKDWVRADLPTTPAKVIAWGNWQQFYDGLKASNDKGDKYNCVLIYGSHFEKANFARGIENFLADMAGEPEFARKLLNKIIDMNMAFLDCVLAGEGIDGVLLGSDWGTQIDLLMSPSVWDEMIRPGEQKEYDLVHSYGKDVWVHSCGKIDKLIPRLVDMGLDVLNPVQPECMDIAMLKKNYGHKLTWWGAISTQTVLPFGTPDDVRTEARRVRDLLSKDGGYIFAPSQDLQNDVPPDNIMALLEVAREGKN
ncbi:MAG: hypothetical protein LLG01_17775 [Planctomycetaceae bacterium]|nr:hypothetical protein [Planctomycetaceae bacterium]